MEVGGWSPNPGQLSWTGVFDPGHEEGGSCLQHRRLLHVGDLAHSGRYSKGTLARLWAEVQSGSLHTSAPRINSQPFLTHRHVISPTPMIPHQPYDPFQTPWIPHPLHVPSWIPSPLTHPHSPSPTPRSLIYTHGPSPTPTVPHSPPRSLTYAHGPKLTAHLPGAQPHMKLLSSGQSPRPACPKCPHIFSSRSVVSSFCLADSELSGLAISLEAMFSSSFLPVYLTQSPCVTRHIPGGLTMHPPQPLGPMIIWSISPLAHIWYGLDTIQKIQAKFFAILAWPTYPGLPLTDDRKYTRKHSHTDPMSGARNFHRNSLPKRSLEGLQRVSNKRPHISTVPASGWDSTTEMPPCLAMCPPPASTLKPSGLWKGEDWHSLPWWWTQVWALRHDCQGPQSQGATETPCGPHTFSRRSGGLRQFSCTSSGSSGPKFLFSSQPQQPQAACALEPGLPTSYFWSQMFFCFSWLSLDL